METERKTLRDRLYAARVRAGLLVSMGALMLVSSVSAADINWTEITSILDGVVDLFPSILSLVLAIFPIIITISIIGFVVAFLDQVLKMIKI